MAELFDRFEVNRVPRWPLMSRLVALSIVLHGLFLVAVVYVPTLRSLIYVAGSVTGIDFVSEDYDRSLVGRRATIVKLEPYEKLYYPPDYFGPPPGAEMSPADPMLIAPPPPPVVIRQPRVRKPRAQAVATPEPTPSPEEIAQATPSPAGTPDEAQRKASEAEIDKAAEKFGVRRPTINSKPFEDLAIKGKEMFDQGKLKLDSMVDVTATAERNEDGTFKPESVKINWASASDEATAELAQMLVTALSQSKALGVLDGVKDVRMALKLDQQNVLVRIGSEFATEAEAKQKADGYATLVGLARWAKGGTDEGELYKNLKIASEGKQLTLTFEMPKDAAGKMIAEMLNRKAAKEKEKAAAAATQSKG